MNSLVLLILKIIGITLLAILGLVILIVLLVLFVPARYVINIDKPAEGDFCINVKIHWLLHFVRVFINYLEELSYRVKILFFTVYKSENLITEKEKIRAEKKANRKKLKEEKNKSAAEYENSFSEKCVEDENIIKSAELTESENATKEEEFTDSENTIKAEEFIDGENATKTEDFIDDENVTNTEELLESDNTQVTDLSDNLESESKKTFIDRILFVLEKLIDLIFNINDKIFAFFNKISDIWENLEYYEEMINDEHNRAAVSICIEKIKGILTDIKPRKIRGNIHIGSDDPYTIGKMMSIYSILLPIIHDKIQLVPEYDQEIIEGQLLVKGHATAYKVLKLLYVYYFNKDVKRLKKVIKKDSKRK